MSKVVLELGSLNRTEKKGLCGLGQTASSILNTGLVLLLLLPLFECFISHFRKEERPGAELREKLHSKGEFTCGKKMKDILKCSSKILLC